MDLHVWEICEFDVFLHPSPHLGMAHRDGGAFYAGAAGEAVFASSLRRFQERFDRLDDGIVPHRVLGLGRRDRLPFDPAMPRHVPPNAEFASVEVRPL